MEEARVNLPRYRARLAKDIGDFANASHNLVAGTKWLFANPSIRVDFLFIDEAGQVPLANAVAMAYPRQVARIQRETRAPNIASAAATLLEQLIRPGFDPAQGAEATRRYVRRKASIAVMEHRKAEAPDRYPWTQVGISERRYYKLLPKFAQKVNGRYVLDQDDVVARMKAHLDRVDQVRAVRAAALDVLQVHGFGEAAARKWLQRHRPEEAVNAWPRDQRP